MFTKLDWKNGYEVYDLIRYETPMDGHCLFHALCQAFFIPYQTGVLNDKPISKCQIIQNLRAELADKLSHPVKTIDGPRYYDLLQNGHINEFATHVPEFTLPNMQFELNSNHCIGYGYIEYIADQLNKDIYILDGQRQDVYKSDETPLVIKNRPSVVLYYDNHHYELIGLKHDDHYDTHFLPTHPLIQFLRQKC